MPESPSLMTSHNEAPVIRLDQWVPYRLFIISARVAELAADYYGPRYGLSQAAWRIIVVVGDKPGMSARQICHATGLDQFAVSRALAQLQQCGFAERSAANRDRRRAEVHLTDEGKRVLEDLSRVSLAIEKQLLTTLDDDQKNALGTLLNELDRSSAGLVSRGISAIVGDEAAAAPGAGGREDE
jgi:DNA-binding MarR family transcriptional regulator